MCCIYFLMLVAWSNWIYCCGHWECQLGSCTHWLVNMTFWRSKHWRACSAEFSEVPVIAVIALKKQCECSLPMSSVLFVLSCGVFFCCLGFLLINLFNSSQVDSELLSFIFKTVGFSPLVIRDWTLNVSQCCWVIFWYLIRHPACFLGEKSGRHSQTYPHRTNCVPLLRERKK